MKSLFSLVNRKTNGAILLYYVIVRDPMDAMISAMSRFWMKPTVDTLFFELQASM